MPGTDYVSAINVHICRSVVPGRSAAYENQLYLGFAFLTLAVSINIDVSLQEIIVGAFTFVAAIGIVHKMKSTRNATVMTFIILGALLFKISDTTASVNCSAQGLQVAILLVPPLTLNNSHDDVKRGSLRDSVISIIKKCINSKNHRNSKNRCNDLAMKLECCQVTNFQEEQIFQESILSNDTDIDIAFPISSRMKKTLSSINDNMSFHELIETPGYSLIMDTGHVNNKANTIVTKKLVQNAWPIVVFAFLFAGIAGVCVWALETFFNQEEFPRSFTRGVSEGFWWAFVSMTTVGYGDRTPKFVFGRLFGVIWIMTGLMVIAIFTATATSSINISVHDLAVVQGRKIGVLANTSAELGAKQRGANTKAYTDVSQLFSDLHANQIDGAFMERYRAAYYLSKTTNLDTLKVFQSYDEKVVYTLAVKGSKTILERGSCFNKLERIDTDTILLNYLKPVRAYDDSDVQSFFSGESKATKKFLLVTSCIFGGLLLIGIISELIYTRLWKSTRKVQNQEGEIEMNDEKPQSSAVKTNLNEVEDKLGQLIREVNKLQEQVAVISSQGNVTYNTTHA